MRTFAAIATAAFLLSGPSAAADEFELNGHRFTLPAGFEIELVAGPALVERPIEADFDEQGRLYVTDSSGSNDKVQEQLEKRPHRVVRLEDSDGNGRFDKSVEFADRLMFPEGALWHDGSLYVAAPPSIWRFTDTDGNGQANQREEWFQGKTLTGCANDLHGPYLGPDGWIYWCKGAFAEQTYDRPGKEPFVTRASHIFRRRPSGAHIEPVMTGGMDNPVGLAFTPSGERIFTTTFLQHPQGGLRDGLIHAVYGGVYGKVHNVIDGHPRTGEIMPVLAHLGAAAPCGLARYEADAFGPDYRDNLFACCFNLHKVTRHVLAPEGAGFKTRDEDFLVSDNLDFHPTDVLEDADGSLLVIDTGGWYKLCCPTSQLWKPDVTGAIYRVRQRGVKRMADPRGTGLEWSALSPDGLAALLDDDRPAVRRRAIGELARKGAAAVQVLKRALTDGRRAPPAAVWALTQVADESARAAVRPALLDNDAVVRYAAAHSASVWRDAGALDFLLLVLRDDVPAGRRVAAEALGRIGDKRAVPALLAAAAADNDRAAEHSVIYALIEIADPPSSAAGLEHSDARVRRAALIALDQMEGGGLQAGHVAALLGSPEPVVRDTAAWIAQRHPEWGGDLAGWLDERLAARDLSADAREELERQLARFAADPAVQELLARSVTASSPGAGGVDLPVESRLSALRAMALAGLKEAPQDWTAALAQVLTGGGDEALLQASVAAARALSVPAEAAGELAPALIGIASRTDLPRAVRLEAAAAVPPGWAGFDEPLFEYLLAGLNVELPPVERLAAADALSKARLEAGQWHGLLGALKTAGPLEIDRLLAAFAQTTDEQLGLALLAALAESPSLSGVRIETLKHWLAKYPPSVQARAEEVYALINVDLAQQRQKLEAILPALATGDVRRGQAVFHSTRAARIACHAMGYLGGNSGPDLTRIGQIRTERDLLEAIVFPSASFVRSFEPVQVATADGQVHNGVVRQDSADQLVLATGPKEEVRIEKSQIEELHPGSVSIMPTGLDKQLTEQELADLVAFLKAAK